MSDQTPEQQFAEALAGFQAEIPTFAKDQTADTGSYSYSYTDLSSLTSRGLPLLAGHGLSWMAKPSWSEHGFALAYSLLHTGGHREDGFYPLPDPTRARPQEIGSAITYARRYAFCAVTGIAPGGEDDDGAAAADAKAAPRHQSRPTDSGEAVVMAARSQLWREAQQLGWSQQLLEEDFARQNDGLTIASATAEQLDVYRQQLGDAA